MKKIVSLILCLGLLCGILCCPVRAEEEPLSVREQAVEQAKMSYRRSLYSAGKESFHGFCGLMTSHQLYNLKINTWCITNDGNKQYDFYRDLPVTTGGYYPAPYSAAQYTLKEALNTVSRDGTKDVSNLLVCFQWTSTAAGARYGHAVLINAILDGMCYFVESFDCSLNTYHPEGSLIVCSIDDFAAYFDRWTTFEGIIHFGTGDYSESCYPVGTDVTVQVRFDTQLRSQPCLVGQNDCVSLRAVTAGERLRATAILTDRLGQQFYRIGEGDTTGYIAAGAVCALDANPEDLVLEDLHVPESLPGKADSGISGAVVAQNGAVGAVEAMVLDSNGEPVLRERVEASGYRWDMSGLNASLCFDLLEPGIYTVEIYGESVAPVLVGGQMESRYGRIRLWEQKLLIGR